MKVDPEKIEAGTIDLNPYGLLHNKQVLPKGWPKTVRLYHGKGEREYLDVTVGEDGTYSIQAARKFSVAPVSPNRVLIQL